MSEIRNLGKINTKILEKEFGKIQTDEIIVINERIDHIKERHPEDYNLFERYGKESVSSPDLIIKDVKKNSVMTFYRIRERNLKKLIEKNGVLYKKE